MLESIVDFLSNNRNIIVGISAVLIGVAFIVSTVVVFSGMACSYFEKKIREIKTAASMFMAGLGFLGLGVEEVFLSFIPENETAFLDSVLHVGTGSVLTGISFIIYAIQGWVRERSNKTKDEADKDYYFSYVGITSLPGLLLLGVASFDGGFSMSGLSYVLLIVGYLLNKFKNSRTKGVGFALSGFGIANLGGGHLILGIDMLRAAIGL